MTNLSKELCEICGIEPKRVRPFLCDKNKENIPCEFCIEKHGNLAVWKLTELMIFFISVIKGICV